MPLSRPLLYAVGSVLLLAQAAVCAQTPCVDCPTPPPCSAEGGCYPKRATWGYYKTRWKRWPTDYAAAAPRPGERSLLPDAEIPKPTEEDRAAPAPSDAKEMEAAEANIGAGTRELDLPAIPALPGLPGGSAPAPDPDAPPALPALPGLAPPPGISPPPAGGPGQTKARPRSGNDAPPRLPSSVVRFLPKPSTVQQVGYTPSPNRANSRTPVPTRTQVRPAYYYAPAR